VIARIVVGLGMTYHDPCFVSLLSDEQVPLEVISRLVGHRSTTVTETVCRKQLRPVIEDGARAMDRIFPADDA
jgi:hypothetical protein